MRYSAKYKKEYTYNMGAIQGSINTMLGSAKSAATAFAVGKEAGLLAQEQYHEASADLTKLQGESASAGEALKVANESVEATKGWDTTGKNGKLLQGKINKRLTEQEAAQRAFDELQDRIAAKQAMMSRAEKIMKRTGTWGGVR